MDDSAIIAADELVDSPDDQKHEYSKSPRPKEYNQNWLRDWLVNTGAAKPDDLCLHEYKGYKVEAPKFQLIRAKNFLADEGADRTVDWESKFARLAEYLTFLKQNYNGEDWGYDLKEALAMLKTHWLYDRYTNSKPELQLDFAEVIPKESTRLPPVPGLEFKLAGGYKPPRLRELDAEGLRPRDHGHGVLYQPGRLMAAPELDGGDPMAYTKSFIWFKNQEQNKVQSVREQAAEDVGKLKRRLGREEPIMPLPPSSNWMGPIVADGLDKDMRETYDTHRSYTSLERNLRLCLRRTVCPGSAREVLSEAVSCMDSGLKRESRRALKLPFAIHGLGPEGEGESFPEEGDGVIKIRPKEVEWLWYLCEGIPNVLTDDVELDTLDEIVLDVVIRLIEDPRQRSLFGDAELKPLRQLLDEINCGCTQDDVLKGPVKRHYFHLGEVWDASKKLEAMGILR